MTEHLQNETSNVNMNVFREQEKKYAEEHMEDSVRQVKRSSVLVGIYMLAAFISMGVFCKASTKSQESFSMVFGGLCAAFAAYHGRQRWFYKGEIDAAQKRLDRLNELTRE